MRDQDVHQVWRDEAVVGKVMQIVKTQVAYYTLLKEKPQIDFLKDDRTPEVKP